MRVIAALLIDAPREIATQFRQTAKLPDIASRLIVTGFVWLALAGPAWALREPDPGKVDPKTGGDRRMATVPYNPGEVFVVHAPQGQTMTVILSAEETSVDVFGTDKFMLKGKNIGNTIVFWTSEELLPHRTVIIVGRTAEGKQRTYTLLVDSMSPEFAHLSLRFTYPEDERAKQAALWRVAAAKKAEAAVLEKVDAKPDCTNFAYQLQGKTTADFNLLPTREVCDDGVHTYFWFPGTMKMPVIYDGAGKETVVDPTFNARTGIAVVHQLSTQWHIRDDDNLLCVFNKAPDPVGRTVFR